VPKQYPKELRERAVRLVAEHRDEYETEYAAIRSIAAKLGIATPETLRQWIRKGEVDFRAAAGRDRRRVGRDQAAQAGERRAAPGQ
jgi:transposase